MESVVYDDSPLARAYLEGEGKAVDSVMGTPEEHDSAAEDDKASHQNGHFAPSTLQKRLNKQRLGQPLRLDLHSSEPLALLNQALLKAIDPALDPTNTEAFLECFRYPIVSSHLLREEDGRRPLRLGHASATENTSTPGEYKMIKSTVNGTVVVVLTSLGTALLVSWIKKGIRDGVKFVYLGIVLAIATSGILVAALLLPIYFQRQRLQALRQTAVRAVEVLTTNLEALDRSATAALTMVKEVEVVSRGFLCGPLLPPITRVEDNTTAPRRAIRIRRLLNQTLTALIPALLEQCRFLRPHLPQNDLDKWFDVSEITDPEVQEAENGADVTEFDDQESLRALGVMQWRLSILRRMLLCHLLSVPADGTQSDIEPWTTAMKSMQGLSPLLADWTEKINKILREDEQLLTVPAAPAHRVSPDRERYRQQLRKINEYSGSIRTMQARLLALREDVVQVLDGQGNIAGLQPLLTAQADALGQDLRMLTQIHETWRSSLNPDQSYRRASWASSNGLRSPVSSLGGLTAVDELGISGGPSDALRALTGELSASGGSPVLGSDEEVFEGVAVPRQRARLSMTREEKVAKLMEEEARRTMARESRIQQDSMMRELETVMTSRTRKRMSTPARLGPGSRISTL